MNAVATIGTDGSDYANVGALAIASREATVASRARQIDDVSGELLCTIAEVLDIQTIFPRVSQIANQVIPHDCLELVLCNGSGELTQQVRSASDFPEDRRCRIAGEEDFTIVGDLRRSRPRLTVCDAPDFIERVVRAGYRSFLNVRGTARHQAMRLGFFSKRPDAYTEAHVAAARRIADYISVAVSHEQLAEAERERREAKARAERLDRRIRFVVEEPETTPGRRRVMGESALWRGVLMKATLVAATETTVFLQGPSGTGKEVVARFIHRASPRKRGPFVAINCAALPEQLLESELFGYDKGAFTGASQPKAGQIELASGGVLFLDEVSEMSPLAQAKFLRFLQEREYQRLGGTRLLKANVRVIAASNRDLRQAVERGSFREDLYYRLQVFDISMPPLRERASDIPLLAEAFLSDFARSQGGSPATLSREAHQMLLVHPWPGNVRELRNVLERAAILCDGGLITREHLSLPAGAEPALPPTTDLIEMERRTIQQVMRETDWNKSRAASRLGLTRTQLYVRLRRYGLRQPAGRP
jgi:transcriptional regulator with GAF, ATPase, and Fis domain